MKSQRNVRAKTLLNGKKNSDEPFPIDLIIEILSRLPVKSIGRCRCVSKLWASIIRLPYFTELFFNRSSARPYLLFACRGYSELFFFSSSQPQNPRHEKSPPVAAKLLTRARFPVGCSLFQIRDHGHGLVCLTANYEPISNDHAKKIVLICNPSTGQALTLPNVKTSMGCVRSPFRLIPHLGYDPVDKQFKVLSITYGSNGINSPLLEEHQEHQVLTLGTQKLEWRKIECCRPHNSRLRGICIDGVLYYPASITRARVSIIVCFDVRSEKYSYIEVETTFKRAVFEGTLINYNGKLGSLTSQGSPWESFELLVIGDFEKQEWSTHKYVLPPIWKNVVGIEDGMLCFAGVIGTNEIVLADHSQVIYYNIEKNTIARVGIRGMEAFPCYNVFAINQNHVEDLKLMEAF